MEEIVIFAIPIFTVLMALEFAYGWIAKRNTYSLTDTLSNLSQGLLSRLSQFVNQFFHIGIYTLLYHWLWSDYENPFWYSGWGIATGLIVFDFCDYWFHRTEHESAIFWASHVIHHQSKHYNLSVALRQVSTEPIFGFVFYLPLALLGMPPQQLLLTVLIVLFYQFWVHTEHIKKLGWFDYVFDSPSNHRVHHAINPQYLDKNYGGFLMVWDHLFGTYEPEVEPCVYGTKKPFDSVDPVWTILNEYVSLFKVVAQAKGIRNKFRSIYKAPGWTPDQLEQDHLNAEVASKDALLLKASATSINSAPIESKLGYKFQNKLETQSEPFWTKTLISVCLVQFFSVVAFSIVFLANEDTTGYTQALPTIGAIVGLCWGLGALMGRSINYLQLLVINLVCYLVLYIKLTPL